MVDLGLNNVDISSLVCWEVLVVRKVNKMVFVLVLNIFWIMDL